MNPGLTPRGYRWRGAVAGLRLTEAAGGAAAASGVRHPASGGELAFVRRGIGYRGDGGGERYGIRSRTRQIGLVLYGLAARGGFSWGLGCGGFPLLPRGLGWKRALALSVRMSGRAFGRVKRASAKGVVGRRRIVARGAGLPFHYSQTRARKLAKCTHIGGGPREVGRTFHARAALPPCGETNLVQYPSGTRTENGGVVSGIHLSCL
jgi:hypothetical protein